MAAEVESAVFNVQPYQYEPLRIRMLQPPMTLYGSHSFEARALFFVGFTHIFGTVKPYQLWSPYCENVAVDYKVPSLPFISGISCVCFAFLYDFTVFCYEIKLIIIINHDFHATVLVSTIFHSIVRTSLRLDSSRCCPFYNENMPLITCC